MGFPIILYVCILLVRYQSKELFKESQKSLNNYLISKTYLEYATWLLVDIDNLLQYADVTTKISKFSHIEERFLEIQRLISLAEEINHSNIKANQETINVLIEHSNFFYEYAQKEFQKTFVIPGDDPSSNKETLQIIETSLKFYDSIQAHLPVDHYEHTIYQASKFSVMAYLESMKENLVFSGTQSHLGMEYLDLSLDMLEQSFQMLDTGTDRREEYEALLIARGPDCDDPSSFLQFQQLQKLHLASTYRETHILKRFFSLGTLDIDEETSESMLDQVQELCEDLEAKLTEASAANVVSAVLMYRSIFTAAGTPVTHVDLLFPPDNFSSILDSREYDYLSKLPVQIAS